MNPNNYIVTQKDTDHRITKKIKEKGVIMELITHKLQYQIYKLENLIIDIENTRNTIADVIYSDLAETHKNEVYDCYIDIQDNVEKELTNLLNPNNYTFSKVDSINQVIYNKQEDYE